MNFLIELLILVAAARIAGEIAQKLKQPAIIGELVAGLILGPAVLGILSAHSNLQILPDLGMFFLMFVIGLQSNLDNIVKVLKPAVLTGFFGTIIPLFLGYYGCLLAGIEKKPAIFIGIAFSMTAVAVLARTLMDLGIEKSKVGQIIIGTSIFDNIFSLMLFAILIPISQYAYTAIPSGIWSLCAKLLFFSLTIILGRILVPLLSPFIKKLEGRGMMFSFSLLIAFLFGEVAQLSGLHIIIGAFLAGLFISEETVGMDSFNDLKNAFSSITFGFFAPIFIMWVAFPVQLNVFSKYPAMLAFIVILAVVTKFLGSFAGAKMSGLSFRESTIIAGGMNGRGAVELVIADIGRRLGIINPSLFSMLVIMALMSSLFTSVFLNCSKEWIMRSIQPQDTAVKK